MDFMLSEIGGSNTGAIREDAEDEPDMLPEYCRYRDNGCELADSCLNCPFPQCIHEEPRGRQRLMKERRNKEIARLFRNEGRGVKELAAMFGLSKRTIQRALRNTLRAAYKKHAARRRR